mmetsp:Transcript_48444/g.122263  ORF Transcript_48444/g.122263 Transcript_48444/m.122263 type:complete len:91 (-) Transcript_48444:184-456(-)
MRWLDSLWPSLLLCDLPPDQPRRGKCEQLLVEVVRLESVPFAGSLACHPTRAVGNRIYYGDARIASIREMPLVFPLLSSTTCLHEPHSCM